MKKTLILVMEVEMSDLSPEERQDRAAPCGCHLNEMPWLRDIGASEVAELLLPSTHDTEAFAGTDICAKVTSSKLLSSSWKS